MNGNAEKILIVDDEFSERERMAGLLQVVGHAVLVAASFVEALRISELQSEPIGLMITDGVAGSNLLPYCGISKADPGRSSFSSEAFLQGRTFAARAARSQRGSRSWLDSVGRPGILKRQSGPLRVK
jgi:hypothetical protein